MTRRLAACLLAAAAVGAAGCRDTANSTTTPGDTVTVYTLLPLEGEGASAARDVVDGAKLALRDARGQAGKLTVNFRSVDTTGDGVLSATSAARAARTVAQDPSAVAAIGALEAGEARVEIPLLNEAGVGLLGTAATAVELREPRMFPSGRTTFSRVVGDDASQARALAALARARHCRALAVLSGPAPEDRSLAALAARGGARRIALARAATLPRGACAVLAASRASAAARAARALKAPRAVLAPSALAHPAFARALGAGAPPVTVLVAQPRLPGAVAAAYARTFRRAAGPDALLGYAAMRAVLAAIAGAGERGNDRAAVAARLQETDRARWTTAVVRGGRLAPVRPHAPTFEP